MKISAADPRLLQHEGRALVFEDVHDLAARVDDPDLECDAIERHGAPERRAGRRARHARVGPSADPREAPARRA